MSDKYLISEEAADEQIEIFLDFYGIDLKEIDSMSDGEGGVSETIRRKFQRSIREGLLEIKEDSDGVKVVQRLKYKIAGGTVTELTYGVVTGKARKAINEKHGFRAQLYQLLAALSREDIAVIEQLRGRDLSAAENLAGLFFAV